MQLIPFPQRPLGTDAATGQPTTTRSLLPGQAPIQGTFPSPSGRSGTAAGWFRLSRFVVVGGRLHAAGVMTAELRDVDGSVVGVGSRRVTVPVQAGRADPETPVLVGPMEVDLLGLTVHVPAFAVEAPRPALAPGPHLGRGLRSVGR